MSDEDQSGVKLFIANHTHRLLSLFWRLQKAEGQEAQHVGQGFYQACWKGLISPVERGYQDPRGRSIDPAKWPNADAICAGEVILVTDDMLATEYFGPHLTGQWPLYGRLRSMDKGIEQSPLAVGGWYQNGQLSAVHWAVTELGAQHGNMGRKVRSSMALYPSERAPREMLELKCDEQLPEWFAGLVRLEVRLDEPDGLLDMKPGLFQAGWPDLHQQLFLSQQPREGGITNMLAGKAGLIDGHIVFGTIISVPPWPSPPTRRARWYKFADMDPQQRGRIVLHDVALQDGKLVTGATDGMVGVVTGQGKMLGTARDLALRAGVATGLDELQLRSDAGSDIQVNLQRMEQLGLL